jgi:hypothetical protein
MFFPGRGPWNTTAIITNDAYYDLFFSYTGTPGPINSFV